MVVSKWPYTESAPMVMVAVNAPARVDRTYDHYSRQRVHNLMCPDVCVCIDILPVRIMSQSFFHLSTLMLSTRIRRI
jgi:hypothetical protein